MLRIYLRLIIELGKCWDLFLYYNYEEIINFWRVVRINIHLKGIIFCGPPSVPLNH